MDSVYCHANWAMSLGGIAIAIGVMVDASLVMVENAHKHIERAREQLAALFGDPAEDQADAREATQDLSPTARAKAEAESLFDVSALPKKT